MASELSRCPFNPFHVMPEDSLQRHIVRCMKNYPTWLACPFNAQHRFPNSEYLTKHMFDCPSRWTVYQIREQEYVAAKNKTGHEVPIHIPGAKEFNLSEENWDKDYK